MIIMANVETILHELKEIKQDLAYIKLHLPATDDVLTAQDLQALQEAREDLKAGRTRRLK